MTGVWGNALDDLKHEQIRHGIRSLSLITDAFPPTPGKFREFCLMYRAPESTMVTHQRDNSPRGMAWRACQIAFSRRVCGMAPPVEVPLTDFDVDFVVNAAPLPKGSSLQEHTYSWDRLRRIFDDEWRAN